MFNTILLGLVSFFSDFSSEMVYPLIPLFLTETLGAAPVLIGIIEGIAECAASILKVFSGALSDRFGKKKPIAFLGYATGLIYKGALLVASSWGGVLVARVTDRIGKGIRTAPRDVLISESAGKHKLGIGFGVHKALDMAGSAVGILCAYFLMAADPSGGCSYRKLFLISMIPAAIGLFMLLFVKEKEQCPKSNRRREPFLKQWNKVHGGLKLYIVVCFVFTLGNSSNAFLLLRAKAVGFTDQSVVLLYLVYNVVAALLSVPFGRLSDRIGRKYVLISGYLIFAVVYFEFGLAQSAGVLVVAFILYGCYAAMISGVERAFIAEIAPPELKGTMLGLQATVVGIALLPASIIAGVFWDAFGAPAPFLFGGALSFAAAVSLIFLPNQIKTPLNKGC